MQPPPIKHYLRIQYEVCDLDYNFFYTDGYTIRQMDVEIPLNGRAWQDVFQEWKLYNLYDKIHRTDVIRREA